MKSVEDRLRELPEDAGLKQIEADDALRLRILRDAAEEKGKQPIPFRRFALAAAAVLVLAAGIFGSVSLIRGRKVPNVLITSQSAGTVEDGAVLRESGFLDVHKGTVSITSAKVPEYRSIWARGSGANFPLVASGGRYYRMLTSPGEVSGSLIGEALGTVAEFTPEPALSGAQTVSNVCPEGTEIYAVSGMKGALAAAEVDGKMRLFQRVSFAGKALIGSETLEDTLCAGRVASMELSGVGTVTGSGAKSLWNTLCSGAVYMNASCTESGQSLLITLDNGLTLQLAVSGGTVSGCGTWACPDFFDAFGAALE